MSARVTVWDLTQNCWATVDAAEADGLYRKMTPEQEAAREARLPKAPTLKAPAAYRRFTETR